MPVALHFTAVSLSLTIVAGLLILAIGAAIITRWLIKHGLQQPFVIRQINRVTDKVIDSVKRPLTIAVLDEVADVLQTGNYTRNIAAALEENRSELKAMVAEKIKDDPSARRLNLVPFSDRLIEQASETTLRVILEILADPRTDELVSDMLRDNITQIRKAVREQDKS
jgi:hypothetical protein